MSSWPADSFCLYCFWQAVRHLWSLHVSESPITQTSTPYVCLGSPVTQTSTLVGMSTWPAGSFFCVVFDRWRDVCGPYMCPGSPVTWTSAPVGMSAWPAGSFYVYCFWLMVRRLWVSTSFWDSPPHRPPPWSVWLGIPDTHRGWRSVWWGTGTHVGTTDVSLVYLTSRFILSVLFLTGSETSVVPTCVQDPLSHWPPPR